MLVHIVKFESALSYDEAMKVARDREADYRATPGLVQKFYVRLGTPNCYAGVMIWENAEALAAFRDTELAKSVPEAYKVIGTPEVSIGETMFLLRETEDLAAA